MKDEEMAEEYCNHLQSEMLAYTPENPRQQRTVSLLDVEDAFLAGLKTGRPQWHDLRKDPTDLPKNRRNVWITYINGYNQRENTEASFRYKYWVISGHRTGCEVIAWCEIPTFDKE